MAKLEKTTIPGVYRRHRKECSGGRCECKYVVFWRDRGRQRSKTFRTLTAAREGKRKSEQAVADGTSLSGRVLLHEYALEWIERYQGTGKRGYRETTRDQDRETLKRYALRYFPKGTVLQEVSPRDIANFINWLTKQSARSKAKKAKGPVPKLSDATIKNAFKPLRGCFRTARSEGLILNNPTSDAVLPYRPRIEDDDDLAQPFPGNTMEIVVDLVNPKHRTMFRLLAETGIRRSELIALEGKHLHLNGEQPYISIRQAALKTAGRGLTLFPPKSRESRRDVPISVDMADELRKLNPLQRSPVFQNQSGKMLNPDNLYARVLRPAMEEVGIKGGFHTFRHTVATRLFAEGRNVVQVQRWLGHSDPAFTIRTYIHLLDNDLGGPIKPLRDNRKTTGCTNPDEIEHLDFDPKTTD